MHKKIKVKCIKNYSFIWKSIFSLDIKKKGMQNIFYYLLYKKISLLIKLSQLILIFVHLYLL